MSTNNNQRKKPNNTSQQSNKNVDAPAEELKKNAQNVTKDAKTNVTEAAGDIKETEKNIKNTSEAQLDTTVAKTSETSKKVDDTVKPVNKQNQQSNSNIKNNNNSTKSPQKPTANPASNNNKSTEVKSDNKPLTATDNKKNQQPSSDEMSNKNTDKNNQKPENKPAMTNKPAEVKNDNNKLTATNSPTEKKSSNLLAPLALIAGIAGTGIGVYNYDQIRKLDTKGQMAPLLAQLETVEGKVAELGGKKTDEVASQLKVELDKLGKTIQSTEEKVNERLSAIEQTQSGLTKTLQGDMKETLDKRLQEVNDLLSKVDQIELTQKSISQNLTQAVAVGEAVTADGMAKQEIGYLIRMADYKIQSEGDAAGAAGLLEIAEKKLLLLNQGQSDNMVDIIRQKYIQLQGVKSVDSNTLISSLKKMSAIVPNLMPKPPESKPVKAEQTTAEEAGSLLGKVGDIIASGVEYTPNDPSKIDISAETILIEKRLMQADIRTAELAVRSQNGVLLAETINSIRANLDKYFADDTTAKAVRKTLSDIEQQKLETVLPDLGGLVKQYEER